MASGRPRPIDLAGSGVDRFRRLLRPGIGLKRWLVVIFLGELLDRHRRRAGAPPGGPRGRSRRRPGRLRHLVPDAPVPAALAARRRPARDRPGDPRLRAPTPAGDAPGAAGVSRRAARRPPGPPACAGTRTTHRGHRWRDRPVDAPARAEGLLEQPDGDRDRGRRRWVVGSPARRHRPASDGRHPELPRRAVGLRGHHDAPAAVPIPRGDAARRTRRPRARQPAHRCPERHGRRLRGRRASHERGAWRCAGESCRRLRCR